MKFTIGIEEEYQLVDPETRGLVSRVSLILNEGAVIMGDQIRPELHQSVVEAGTKICSNIKEAREDIRRLRGQVHALATKHGFRIAAAATHPFSDWKLQEITPKERYLGIIEDMQDIARANLIFGLHVHIGIEDRDLAVDLMNMARYFLPHVLALSTNSPLWLGRVTGLKSTRCTLFQRFPRTGIPDYFYSWSEYAQYLELLVKTGCIDNGRKIWWDVRPHPVYPTLEFRICDLPTTVWETISIAALFQAIIVKLYKLYQMNQGFRIYRRALIEENKWRAIRYGLDGKLIDFGKKKEVPTRELIPELLEFVDDVVDELGSREEIEKILTLVRDGTGADRQLKVFTETGDLRKVVDDIMERTLVEVV